ncbi:MAG: LysR substrate-binding domain-containing protein [Nitrospirae bacterium]|jgi:DNA-binding transcriptional LysR family regulator|nr:LysR substrate-binding domain-containing protein [Nitrospirota bacterium]
MTHDQLRIFLKVAELGSFTQAGETLFLTQPAISLQVKTLEQHLGVPLFERKGRQVLLTEAGVRLLPHARRIMDEIADARARVAELSSGTLGNLRIGSSTTIGTAVLPSILYDFSRKNPQIRTSLSILNTHRIVFDLKTSEIDIGFIEGDLTRTESQGVRRTFLAQDRLVLVDSRNNPFIVGEETSLEEIRRLPLILREPGSGTRQVLEDALLDRELPLDLFTVSLTVGHTGVIKKMVAKGAGIAFMSVLAVEKTDRDQLRIVRVRDFSPIRDLWIVTPGRRMSSAARLFLDGVQESMNRMSR